MIQENLDERLLKLKSLLNISKQRNLTLKGKITILRAQAMPLIMFVSSFLNMPKEILDLVDSLFYDFLWPNGKHHVKKNTIINTIENGGLKMPDIVCIVKATKFQFIKRILTYNNNSTSTAKYILKTDKILQTDFRNMVWNV